MNLRVSWDASHGPLGRLLGGILGAFWGLLGASWGVLEASWTVLEPSWASWNDLWTSWALGEPRGR